MKTSLSTLLLASSLPLLACCTTPTSVASPAPARGKPSAPVAVTAQLAARSAHLVITPASDAKDLTVVVSGVDGLTVDGEPRRELASLNRGERLELDVGFTPGPGRSQLVVSVSGTFGGGHRARVAAFAVGEGAAPESPGTVMTTDDGTTVKVLPAATPGN